MAEPHLQWLRSRRSVWVLGDATEAQSWRRVIAGLMGGSDAEVALLSLGIAPDTPEAKSGPKAR